MAVRPEQPAEVAVVVRIQKSRQAPTPPAKVSRFRWAWVVPRLETTAAQILGLMARRLERRLLGLKVLLGTPQQAVLRLVASAQRSTMGALPAVGSITTTQQLAVQGVLMARGLQAATPLREQVRAAVVAAAELRALLRAAQPEGRAEITTLVQGAAQVALRVRRALLEQQVVVVVGRD